MIETCSQFALYNNTKNSEMKIENLSVTACEVAVPLEAIECGEFHPKCSN